MEDHTQNKEENVLEAKDTAKMVTIVGVRFRTVGKIYYFNPKNYDVGRGSHVIVETARGVEFGTVILGPKEVPESEITRPLKGILRVATQADEDRELFNRSREREAYAVCRQKIREHHLDMKLIQAEYTFDNNKLLFYFTADGRIDFRNLVKDLASEFRTRIELRQIGVRDETKILGGVGICGRELCCHTFLSDFAPVSIKMAKEQSLSLNPTKISGTCGRLMCCLNNEAETYEYLNSRLPRQGSYVKTPDGVTGRVQSVSVLRQHVKVMVENGDEREIREYSIDELNGESRNQAEGAERSPARRSGHPGIPEPAKNDAGTSRKKNRNGGDEASKASGGRGGQRRKNAGGKNAADDARRGKGTADTRNGKNSDDTRSSRNTGGSDSRGGKSAGTGNRSGAKKTGKNANSHRSKNRNQKRGKQVKPPRRDQKSNLQKEENWYDE